MLFVNSLNVYNYIHTQKKKLRKIKSNKLLVLSIFFLYACIFLGAEFKKHFLGWSNKIAVIQDNFTITFNKQTLHVNASRVYQKSFFMHNNSAYESKETPNNGIWYSKIIYKIMMYVKCYFTKMTNLFMPSTCHFNLAIFFLFTQKRKVV